VFASTNKLGTALVVAQIMYAVTNTTVQAWTSWKNYGKPVQQPRQANKPKACGTLVWGISIARPCDLAVLGSPPKVKINMLLLLCLPAAVPCECVAAIT
jgi:hypothetical protein